MGIHITTSPQGKGFMRSFNREAEALIEMDRGRVIHIYCQLYAPYAEPIISGIQHCCHKRRTHAAPYPAVMHAHTQICRVVLTTA